MTLGTHSIHAVPFSRTAIKHILPRSQPFWCVFWGSFVPFTIQPLYLAAHLRASGQSSWRAADRSACSGPRRWWESWPEVRGGGGRRWGESERWKWRMEGRRTQRSGASDPQGPGLTQRRPPLLCPPRLFPPPPPLLCHSGLDYFILIRLIPPRGKLLITSPPPTPPDESNLLSAWGQDEGEGLLRLIGDKNVKGETEKGPWQQLWSASMRRFGPPRLDKLAGGTPFVAIDPPTSL